jgi:hypothetical protein
MQRIRRPALRPQFAVLQETQLCFQTLAPAHILWYDELIGEGWLEARREAESLS